MPISQMRSWGSGRLGDQRKVTTHFAEGGVAREGAQRSCRCKGVCRRKWGCPLLQSAKAEGWVNSLTWVPGLGCFPWPGFPPEISHDLPTLEGLPPPH